MTKFSTTVDSELVSKFLILICSVMLPLVLSQFFDTDESNGCILFVNFDNQLYGMKYLGTRFGWASVPRKRPTGCIILFSLTAEMSTKYSDFPVIAINDV